MALLDDYLTCDELAAELRVSPRTVKRWQAAPDGLPYTEMGGRVLYRRASVRAWLESRERHPNKRRVAA
jgi:excisionase family DNA binding protein